MSKAPLLCAGLRVSCVVVGFAVCGFPCVEYSVVGPSDGEADKAVALTDGPGSFPIGVEGGSHFNAWLGQAHAPSFTTAMSKP